MFIIIIVVLFLMICILKLKTSKIITILISLSFLSINVNASNINIENKTTEVINVIDNKNTVKNPDHKYAKNIIPFGERNKVFLNMGLLIFIVIIGIFGFFWMKKDKQNE